MMREEEEEKSSQKEMNVTNKAPGMGRVPYRTFQPGISMRNLLDVGHFKENEISYISFDSGCQSFFCQRRCFVEWCFDSE